MSTPDQLKKDIVAYAQSLGFGPVGITTAEPLKAAGKSLGDWVEEGCAGEMSYMEKDWEVRARPADRLPGAKSIISLAVSYYDGDEAIGRWGGGEKKNIAQSPHHPISPSKDGRVARYAWGKDYHKTLQKRLESLTRYMEALAPGVRCKTYLDTGPLLERAVAQRAGLGFTGKNTVLITRGQGSWVFLASVLTTLDLPVDGPDTRTCGSCTLCIDACPTQAITEPYHLDARRCIAYLTIELKNEIPQNIRSHMGEWFFGCDVCQDVCPHNVRPVSTPIPELRRESGVGSTMSLKNILSMKSDAELDEHWPQSPVKRAGRNGLVRNACVTAANQNRIDLLPQLETLAIQETHPMVREHARWAVEKLQEERAAK